MTRVLNHGDRTSWLETVWDALHDYRENNIPEGVLEYDDQWSDITTAMAWITEALGEPTGADAAPPLEQYVQVRPVKQDRDALDTLQFTRAYDGDVIHAWAVYESDPSNGNHPYWKGDFGERDDALFFARVLSAQHFPRLSIHCDELDGSTLILEPEYAETK